MVAAVAAVAAGFGGGGGGGRRWRRRPRWRLRRRSVVAAAAVGGRTAAAADASGWRWAVAVVAGLERAAAAKGVVAASAVAVGEVVVAAEPAAAAECAVAAAESAAAAGWKVTAVPVGWGGVGGKGSCGRRCSGDHTINRRHHKECWRRRSAQARPGGQSVDIKIAHRGDKGVGVEELPPHKRHAERPRRPAGRRRKGSFR